MGPHVMTSARGCERSRQLHRATMLAALLVSGCGGAQGGSPAGAGNGPATGGTFGDASGSGGASGGAASGTGGGASPGTGGSPSQGGSGGASGTGGASGSGATGGGGASGQGGVAGTGGASGSGGTPAADAGAPPAAGPLFPPANGQALCPDPPLRISFTGPPTVGTSGKIQVFDAAQTATPVAAIDLATTSFSDTIGGTLLNVTRPVYVDGNDVIVKLPTGALHHGHTYYVTVTAGALSGPGSMTLTDPMAWRFTTAAAAPTNLSALTVALDGTGDFCSVQGALDALPAGSSSAAMITIKRGTYHEIIHASSKNNVTLHGEDRKATIIAGTNNEMLNSGTAKRSLVGIDASKGLIVENLTIHNLTPQGGSQAEALRLQTCDQCVVRDADIVSLQDTLLWSGRIYAKNCYIEGNVDFVWGTGAAYFDHCEIKTAVRSGYVVQARNTASGNGYVFVDSKITSDSGVTGSTLGRIDVSVYPASHVAYINCQIGNHISAAGWTITGGGAPSSLRFWEYQSTDLAGNALDVSKRIAGSTQITSAQAATMRDPKMVLGGWQPPN
jgi:pectin methylesterase-like acyl-CoA thioesterase